MTSHILAGKHFSWEHICATEYWQLVTTYAYANLSGIIVVQYQFGQAGMCYTEG